MKYSPESLMDRFFLCQEEAKIQGLHRWKKI